VKSGAWIGESCLNVRAGFIPRYSMCGAFRFNIRAGLPYLCRGGVYPRPKVMAVRFCSHALQREETMSEIASYIRENPVRLFVGKDTSKIHRVWIRCLAQLAGILRARVNPAPTLVYFSWDKLALMPPRPALSILVLSPAGNRPTTAVQLQHA
jgi:hypothetical protein